MQTPFQVTIRDVRRTARLDETIERHRARLEKLRPDLTGASLVIERPHEREAGGKPVRVRLLLRVPPGHEIVAIEDARNHHPSEPLHSIVGATFATAERQLEKLTGRLRSPSRSRVTPAPFVDAPETAAEATWSVDSEIVESIESVASP